MPPQRTPHLYAREYIQRPFNLSLESGPQPPSSYTETDKTRVKIELRLPNATCRALSSTYSWLFGTFMRRRGEENKSEGEEEGKRVREEEGKKKAETKAQRG